MGTHAGIEEVHPVPGYGSDGIPIRLDEAALALYQEIGPYLEADYLPGKTEIRDALYFRFELSQLEAEELCDSVERAGLIEFTRSDDGVGAWVIRHD